jgi:uncharacterized protein
MVTPSPPVILPPFNEATARLKVQLAEDTRNTRDPERAALAYTEDSQWQNRDAFFDQASGLIRRRDASVNDYPIAPSERRVALP